MHISNKVAGIAAVLVLAAAGMTAVAWAQPAASTGASTNHNDHGDKDEDAGQGPDHEHGLHLGHVRKHPAQAGQGPDLDHGLHLGKAHKKTHSGKDYGLHLGYEKHRKHPGVGPPPGHDKHKAKPKPDFKREC